MPQITVDLNSLSSDLLEKRLLLPEKPSNVVLEGKYVILKPLDLDRDAQPLFEISNGQAIQMGEKFIDTYDANECIWRYMMDGPFENLSSFIVYLNTLIHASNAICFCVFDKVYRQQVGIINLLNNFPAHLKLELGSLWYSPIVQRTYTNTEASYLLLKHAFELGYRRLEWKCHSQNQRSWKAALKLGFKFEGIQESHLIIKGSNRDTAWFRILKHEWPAARERLESILYSNV